MIRRIMMLEFSQYLENYLWPNYNPESSSASHVLSIVIMVNEKFRERVSAWQVCVCLIIQSEQVIGSACCSNPVTNYKNE